MASMKAPEFRVDEVFPADDPKCVAVVRLLVATQSLISLGRLLGDLLPKTPAYRETKHYLMLLSLGLANEAASAFLAAQHAGAFEDFAQVGWKEMDERFERLVKECNRDDPASLRSKLVAYGRNLVFHWNKDEIKKALAAVGDLTLPAWSGGEDETPVTMAIPLAEAVSITALGLHVGNKEELSRIMAQVGSFQGDLLHFAQAVYTTMLRKHLRGNRTTPASTGRPASPSAR